MALVLHGGANKKMSGDLQQTSRYMQPLSHISSNATSNMKPL